MEVYTENWSAVERTIDKGEFELLASVSGLVAIVNRGGIRKLRLSRPVEMSIAKANERTKELRERRDVLPLEFLRRYLAGRKFIQRVRITVADDGVVRGTWYWRHKDDHSEKEGGGYMTGPEIVAAEAAGIRRSHLAGMLDIGEA